MVLQSVLQLGEGLSESDVRRIVDDSAQKLYRKTDESPAKARTKTGRNDPCPCGSGKKYKHCCEGR
jgi:uncharacterized protein YchJ